MTKNLTLKKQNLLSNYFRLLAVALTLLATAACDPAVNSKAPTDETSNKGAGLGEELLADLLASQDSVICEKEDECSPSAGVLELIYVRDNGENKPHWRNFRPYTSGPGGSAAK